MVWKYTKKPPSERKLCGWKSTADQKEWLYSDYYNYYYYYNEFIVTRMTTVYNHVKQKSMSGRTTFEAEGRKTPRVRLLSVGLQCGAWYFCLSTSCLHKFSRLTCVIFAEARLAPPILRRWSVSAFPLIFRMRTSKLRTENEQRGQVNFWRKKIESFFFHTTRMEVHSSHGKSHDGIRSANGSATFVWKGGEIPASRPRIPSHKAVSSPCTWTDSVSLRLHGDSLRRANHPAWLWSRRLT